MGRSGANAVSVDGKTVVGVGGPTGAWKWAEETGIISLPCKRCMLGAEAVSADGSVVFGSEFLDDEGVVVRWDAKGDANRYVNPEGVKLASIKAVTPDGTLAVGFFVFDIPHGHSTKPEEAVMWLSPTKMVSLGYLHGTGTRALAVNSDGSVVVGVGGGALPTAFRWTKETGMQTVSEWIASAGGKRPESEPRDATGVSADGSRVVGTLRNGNPYVAIVPVGPHN